MEDKFKKCQHCFWKHASLKTWPDFNQSYYDDPEEKIKEIRAKKCSSCNESNSNFSELWTCQICDTIIDGHQMFFHRGMCETCWDNPENHKLEDEEDSHFVYQGTFEFDPTSSPLDSVLIEKKKYKDAIAKQIKDLEKDIEKKEFSEKDNEDMYKHLMNRKSNHREIQFEYEKGEIFPKDIIYPELIFIQYAEPHVLITDLFDEPNDWYYMHKMIKGFAEESFLSYQMGMWYSSISAAINCCEYILKYEYFRDLNKFDSEKAEKASNDKFLSLGSFKTENKSYDGRLNLSKEFIEKISYINDVRVSLYHFSPNRSKNVNEKGELEVEKDSKLEDDMIIPIIAYRVYLIMYDLINHYYNKKKALEYLNECVKDWKNKRNIN